MSVLLETTWGDITIDLLTDAAPNACKNFLKLCKIKYYNNCCFHYIQPGFLIQTGDPTATGKGGESVYHQLYGEQARYFPAELREDVKHDIIGTVAMAGANKDTNGSQFYITCRDSIEYLDGEHPIFGRVVEGMDVVMRINEAFVDDEFRPFQVIKIKHTLILDDPFPDPSGLNVPPNSPQPGPPTDFERVRITKEDEEAMAKMSEAEMERIVRQKEAQSRAVILEMVEDIPDADMKPPEDVLFVCKLNPVTEDEDLEIIFSRFGKVLSCEIIRDRNTNESLCYGFVEFETKEECEMAYFKMDNALVDDRRIKVDFSQSVAKLWNNFRRGKAGGGGSKKIPDEGTQSRLIVRDQSSRAYGGANNKQYDFVFDENEQQHHHEQGREKDKGPRDEETSNDKNTSKNSSQGEGRGEADRYERRAPNGSERPAKRGRWDDDKPSDRNKQQHQQTQGQEMRGGLQFPRGNPTRRSEADRESRDDHRSNRRDGDSRINREDSSRDRGARGGHRERGRDERDSRSHRDSRR
eukprot:c10625_g1_i2.p1 GENE.c10625_g1_i2~~c10625_g1_i2.p1  ORF type:complete len:567 (+),score=121.68 c10625_g1_i2:131-1702(+)